MHSAYGHALTNTENTLPLFMAHLAMQKLLNIHQSTSIYQLEAIYTLPVEIITSQLTACLQWI